VPRFRKTNGWSLRLGAVICYRTREGRITGTVVELAVDPQDGSAVGAVRDEGGRTRPFRLTRTDAVRRRLLGLGEILADPDGPPPSDRPVLGYHLRVGRERDALWLHRYGEEYAVKQEKPAEPPFRDRTEAESAGRWVSLRAGEVATLVEPVYAAAPATGSPRC